MARSPEILWLYWYPHSKSACYFRTALPSRVVGGLSLWDESSLGSDLLCPMKLGGPGDPHLLNEIFDVRAATDVGVLQSVCLQPLRLSFWKSFLVISLLTPTICARLQLHIHCQAAKWQQEMESTGRASTGGRCSTQVGLAHKSAVPFGGASASQSQSCECVSRFSLQQKWWVYLSEKEKCVCLRVLYFSAILRWYESPMPIE